MNACHTAACVQSHVDATYAVYGALIRAVARVLLLGAAEVAVAVMLACLLGSIVLLIARRAWGMAEARWPALLIVRDNR